MSPSNLPPLSSDGIFAVSASSDIAVPRDKVWNILLDFPKYKEWNPFTRGQTLVSASSQTPLPDQTPFLGAHILMKPVHIPPTMDDTSVWFPSSSLERITVLDHDNYRCSWVYISKLPKWMMHTERWQSLTVVQGEGEKEVTRYESILVFHGLLAYVIKLILQTGLKESSQAMGEALKERAEQRK